MTKQLGDKVTAKHRKDTVELTITKIDPTTKEISANYGGAVVQFIAEGRHKKSDWAKLGLGFEDGSYMWLT